MHIASGCEQLAKQYNLIATVYTESCVESMR